MEIVFPVHISSNKTTPAHAWHSYSESPNGKEFTHVVVSHANIKLVFCNYAIEYIL